jgi:hypothetical protein
MKIDLTSILPDLNAIIAYADAVSVGAKSGCIIHIIKKAPQVPMVYLANDMNTVYGKFAIRGAMDECDIAFRSHLFPEITNGSITIEATREGVVFNWKKQGIDKSALIPRESEIQSIVNKAFERDWSWDNHVNLTSRIFAAFEKDIGVAELKVSPRNVKVIQFKPNGEEKFEHVYDFKTSAKGWGAMESSGKLVEKSVTLNTLDFTKISLLTGDNDFGISINGQKPLCVSIAMDTGTLQLMLSHMVYRL